MPRVCLVALVCASLAGAVAFSADHARWSALALHAEPLLLTALAIGAYVAWARRHRAAAVGLILGGVVGFGLVRIPARATEPRRDAPAWARAIEGCAMALDAPSAPVDVLQWTLTDGVSSEAVQRAVEVISPDVLVLFDLNDPSVLVDLVQTLGGEYQHHPATATSAGFGVYSRGEFSLCDGTDQWDDGTDGPGGYRFVFVGLDRATFPLVVARFPGPLAPGDWAGAMAESTDRVDALLATIRSPLTVVVADAPVTGTYRHLFAGLTGLGMHAVPTPPNFPARLGTIPLLPLHAYDRAWTGPGWSTLTSRRVGMSSGVRTPVWTRLEPAERGTAGAAAPMRNPG